MPESSAPYESMVLQASFPGRVAEAYERPDHDANDHPEVTVDQPTALDPTLPGGVQESVGAIPSVPIFSGVTGAEELSSSTPGFDFYERFHVIARSYDFGNVLSTQQDDIEVHSAYRRLSFDWTTFVNGAGAGTSLVGQPTLPETIEPCTSEQMTLQVEVVGPAIVDDTLDFGFGDGTTIMVPITFQRIVMLAFEPELPMVETLEFLTDVFLHLDGTEQRVRLRTNPRQFFDLEFKLDEGPDMALFDNVLFEWQHRLFGLPIWHERTALTVAASVNDTTINVGETAYRDFREGGLAVVLTDERNFDVQEIATGGIAATTLTFVNGLLNGYPVGTKVMPLRTAHAEGVIGGQRNRVNLGMRRMVLRVTDNDVGSIASGAAFSTYNGKVLLDDCNLVNRVMSENHERQITVLDYGTGDVIQTSTWDTGRRQHTKGFTARGPQKTWELRQLMHLLAGRQTSLYIPTFWKDLEANADLVSGASTMSITNVGYNRYAQERQNRDVIRVVFKPSVGQSPLIRVIQSSTEVDADNESLTLDTTWPANFATSDILRIEYISKVRLDTDKVRFRHKLGIQSNVECVVPVKEVLE